MIVLEANHRLYYGDLNQGSPNHTLSYQLTQPTINQGNFEGSRSTNWGASNAASVIPQGNHNGKGV